MSVEVNTPTKTAFDHRSAAVFSCAERTNEMLRSSPAGTLFSSTGTGDKQPGHTARRYTVSGGRPEGCKGGRKRRNSERVPSTGGNSEAETAAPSAQGGGPHAKKRFGKGWTKATPDKKDKKKFLPSKFLLGGNISDPLNLNSLCDEEVNRILNESTPHSSPVPLPAHKKEQLELLIPPNINDPLNLDNSAKEDACLTSPKLGGKNRKKNKYKKKRSNSDINNSATSACEDEADDKDEESPTIEAPVKDFTRPVHIDIIPDTAVLPPPPPPHAAVVAASRPVLSSLDIAAAGAKPPVKQPIDKIVSPVIPQRSPPRSRKRRRTFSDGGAKSQPPCVQKLPMVVAGKDGETAHNNSSCSSSAAGEKPAFVKPTDPPATTTPAVAPVKVFQRAPPSDHHHRHHRRHQKSKAKRPVFEYGNYNRYYGYRNPDMEDDQRVHIFQREWFEGKDALDIGCNVGHITLTIGRDLYPRRIIGMDIDASLIAIAKKNIRHYLSAQETNVGKYATSLPLTYGPISAPSVPCRDQRPEFPNNVMFMQANYVLERDELLDLQREEYDVILALSITKWIHLNFGDAGMKRFFKRIFKQLRPGGKLILESQGWTSYKKKKKLTDTIFKNFQGIQMRPEQFREYLLTKEVGFSTCEKIDIPFNKSKGFQRPILVFTKSETAATTPYSRGVTPHVHGHHTPGGAHTPGYTLSSRGGTPKFSLGSPYAPHGGVANPKPPKYSCTPLLCGATTNGESSPSSTPKTEPAAAAVAANSPLLLAVKTARKQDTHLGDNQKTAAATEKQDTDLGDTNEAEEKTSGDKDPGDSAENIKSGDTENTESGDIENTESINADKKESVDTESKESVEKDAPSDAVNPS